MRNKDIRKYQPFCDKDTKKHFGHLCSDCLKSLRCEKNNGITIVMKCERYRKRERGAKNQQEEFKRTKFI
ncbi:MAG: hypothetical protein ACI4IS_00315 [Acutalibacteraceae bacterium]